MRWLRVCSVACATVLSAGSLAFPDVKEGDVRSTQSKVGTALREKPAAFAKRVDLLPYGTRVKVSEVSGFWAAVAVEGAATKGWLRSVELVEPGTLTGPGAYGDRGSEAVASTDVTAAGRQFDAKTERTWRAMKEDLEPYYGKVDEIERATPSEEEVVDFIRKGLLGKGADEPTPKFASLRLLSATGSSGIPTAVAGPTAPLPLPTNDAQFVERLSMNFSPEQEYYLGRAVAAAAIGEYGLDPDPVAQATVRKIGASLIRLADRIRSTHGGWHFAVLSGATANGVSGPGGFVLVTRGALDLCRNEDEVAGILAHEIAHVALKHGEALVRRQRDFEAAMAALVEKVRRPVRGPDGCNICPDVAKLLGAASESLEKSLNVNGYGREYEFDADWEGSLFLCEVGYRASALAEYLEVIPTREGARWTTHPSSVERIDALRPIVNRSACDFECDGGAQARLVRFRSAMGRGTLPSSASGGAAPSAK